MYLHIAQFLVVQLKCVPVADAGVPLGRSCYPPLHLGDGAGMWVGDSLMSRLIRDRILDTGLFHNHHVVLCTVQVQVQVYAQTLSDQPSDIFTIFPSKVNICRL